ncbi:MAG: hypothetical protein M3O70_22325, partial [Actinomycetota bacterium]|nr:hypothetical protein [Actinomycetota bacterium]
LTLPPEPGPPETTRLLILLMGLDTDSDLAAAAVDEKILHAACRRFFEALGRTTPVCLMIADIHWADDALLDLLQSITVRARDTGLLVVTQARRELLERRPSWGASAAATSLPLEPLDEAGTRELVAALTGEEALATRVVGEIVRLSGGNPLLVEELVAMAAETGTISAMPPTLRSLILARLDALPEEERLLLQVGSVFGTTFWPQALPFLGLDEPFDEVLGELERRNLLHLQLRSQFAGNIEYAFKHVLIRDVAYDTLPRRQRRDLHRRALEWLEQTAGERVEEHLDQLAHHAVEAGDRRRAIPYLDRAAQRAHRAATHRQEAALLAQAIEIADGLIPAERIAELRARRGRAFARVGMWAEARPDLEAAAVTLPFGDPVRRTQTLLDLAMVCDWLNDIPALRRHASEALGLAERAGRRDLVLEAMALQINADSSDGATASAINRGREVIAQARRLGLEVPYLAWPSYPLLLYWTGRSGEATEFARQALSAARGAHDTSAIMWHLPQLGLALTAEGRYGEALDAFDESRSFGQEYEVWPLLARAIAMSVGLHLDLLDFDTAEALATEARELALSTGFALTQVSAGLDLLFNLARRQEVGRADKLRHEVVEDVERAAGSHGWLWRLRFAQAEAELALARGDAERAVELAAEARRQSRARGRVKYQVLALLTRGAASHHLGRTKEALPHLRRAVELARHVDDPALVLRATRSLLTVDGDEDLAAEAQATARRIAAALPEGALRQMFEKLSI